MVKCIRKGDYMKMKILRILLALLIIFGLSAVFIFYGLYFAPKALSVDLHTIQSSKIPESMNDVKIGYFSDIYFLEYMDEERLTNMFETINEQDVDILLFGGDLFSNPSSDTISAEQINFMTQQLLALDAPFGKFYVLGDIDQTNPELINTIMYNAEFELISNRNLKIHNNASTSITLIGLDNTINATPNIETAFTNTSIENFNLLFTHTPDGLLLFGEDSVDLAIAGHSLGGQVSIPIIGSLGKIEGAITYEKGIYKEGNSTYYISNGLGTTGSDFRLFTPPQFQVFLLQSNK